LGPGFFILICINKQNHEVGSCDCNLRYRDNANAIIFCHNHSSGNLLPSEANINLTKRVKDVLKLMDVQLLDHLIIAAEGEYYSTADREIM
jgi:DNA repair protein RadC